jgi:hypothetical protein
MTTVYTFDEDSVSDLHKDAYGFRPYSAWWSWWNICSDDEKQAEWEMLIRAMKRSMEQEEIIQIEMTTRFESRIDMIIASGAGDRKTAVRWMMDSMDVEHHDVSYFEYLNGIAYGHLNRTQGV